MADDDDFVPPPDLHALIKQYGAYSAIPPQAWADYDRAVAEWKADFSV
jgi:hypothetical protein